MKKIHFELFLILSFSIISQLVAQKNGDKVFSLSVLAQSEQAVCDHGCKHHPNLDQSIVKYRFVSFKDDLTFVSRIAIWAYQILISSQNQSICMFEPSCSAFALEAIQEYGLKGVFLSADRISRCNSFGAIYYNEKLDDGRFKDSPEKYFNK